MRVRCVLICVLVSHACGGAGPEHPVEPGVATSSGPTSGAEAPEEGAVRVMRTTTPIPVPQPGVPRDELSDELKALWDAVEAAVALRPPEPPTDASTAGISAWANEQFAPFLTTRVEAIRHAEQIVETLHDPTLEERGLSAALLGYMHEDTAASVRGAPVPESIAKDPELLRIYVATLTEAVQPMAVRSAAGYQVCVRTFAGRQEGPWAEYAAYCDARGAEVVDVYELRERGGGVDGGASSDVRSSPSDVDGEPDERDAGSNRSLP